MERSAIKYFRARVTNAGLQGAATEVDREAAAVPSFLPRAWRNVSLATLKNKGKQLARSSWLTANLSLNAAAVA